MYSLICCIVNAGRASKILEFAKKYGVKGGTISIGRGTIHHRLLKLLALDEVRKEIVTMVVERELASQAIAGISKDMDFEKPNHGIAFSYSVAEFIGRSRKIKTEINETDVKGVIKEKDMYNIIYAIVNKGSAEDVIDAANKAGSEGGTIINARGAGIHEVQKLFDVPIEREKEEVLIITKKELKNGIIESIRKELKIDEPGNGVLFVLDVDEVYGLHN